MRSCCVSGCSSGQHAPRHAFPKNAERRKTWFQYLNMEPLENENEIKKLRICYRHFRDEHYSDSAKNRVLLHFAVPSENLSQHVAELVDVNCIIHAEREQETLFEHKCTVVQENHEKVLVQNEDQSVQNEVQSIQNEVQSVQNEDQSVQNEDQLVQNEIQLVQNEVQLAQNELQLVQYEAQLAQHEVQLAQHEVQLAQNVQLAQHEMQLAQHEVQFEQIQEIIKEQQQRIENFERALEMQSKTPNVKPYLANVTRRALTPEARRFYDKLVKMKKALRKQKRLKEIEITTRKKKSQTIQLKSTDRKGNVDSTVHVRQNFTNMIVRNNAVTPQVPTT